MNYILNAFKLMEKELSECRRTQALNDHSQLNDKKPRMQQDINIIHDDEANEPSSAKNKLISELKQTVATKDSFVENQRKIIENRDDKIFRLNDEKERLQRDIENLKKVFSRNVYPSSFIHKCILRCFNNTHIQRQPFHTVTS